jgi:hypothetical protein
VVADGSCHFPITPIRPQLPASNNTLFPRRRSIVDPQVRFNVVVRNQFLKASTWFIPAQDPGKRHVSTEPSGDHRDGGCATEPVFLFIDSNDDARLFRIQLRRVANQVSIKDQVANHCDVWTLAILKHGK